MVQPIIYENTGPIIMSEGPMLKHIGRRSARRESLDHVLIFHEKQLHHALRAYVDYFYQARPHQGITVPVMDGLNHEYRRAAS